MMNVFELFFLGGVFTTWMCWQFFAFWIVAIVAFFYAIDLADTDSWGFLWGVAAFVSIVAFLTTGFNPYVWVVVNWKHLFEILAYWLGIGLAASGVYWAELNSKAAVNLKKWRDIFFTTRSGLGLDPTKGIPSNLIDEYNSYMRSRGAIIPEVGKYSDQLVIWVMWWPFKILSFMNPRKAILWIIKRFGKMYSTIQTFVFRDINKDLKLDGTYSTKVSILSDLEKE